MSKRLSLSSIKISQAPDAARQTYSFTKSEKSVPATEDLPQHRKASRGSHSRATTSPNTAARYAAERHWGKLPDAPGGRDFKSHTDSGGTNEMADTYQHLAQIREVTPSAEGCEDCLRTGDTWVHLRLCETCGHVGCCDSSRNRHATRHYRATGHPVIKSFEPGEEWGWCFVDGLFFESL
jgi:hypothetical protein